MLTIFTPTYNRANLLSRVYESLKRQTCKDFLWLIVDDGSTDDTKSLIESFIAQAEIDIRYFYQKNGGKMRAHNEGVRLCETELFMCLDSDDYITDDAVKDIYAIWNNRQEIEHCIRHIGGIVAHKGKSENELLGCADFPEGVKVSTLNGLYRKGFSGETTLVFLTEALKKYPFPEFEGEKYVPEDVVYDKIDSEYELLVLPKVLTICEIVDNGYTQGAAKLRRENPNGWFVYYEQRMINTPLSVLKFKYVSHYCVFAKILNKNVFREKQIGIGYLLLGQVGGLMLKMLGKT